MKKHSENIHIIIVPYNYPLRYDTLGDWLKKNGEWYVMVPDTKKWKHNVLIALHEFIEMVLCRARGIPESEIMKFDVDTDLDNPGADEKAPYHKEHMTAEKFEKMLAKELGVDWEKYNEEI